MQNLYSCILQTPSQHGGSAEPDAGLCPEQGVLPRWKKLTDTNHKAGTPPCLHKPCHTRALHRADQAGIWRKEAQPKQGWLQYIRGSVREVMLLVSSPIPAPPDTESLSSSPVAHWKVPIMSPQSTISSLNPLIPIFSAYLHKRVVPAPSGSSQPL